MIGCISGVLCLAGLCFLWEAAPGTEKKADLAQGVCAALLSLTSAAGFIIIAAAPEVEQTTVMEKYLRK